MHTPQPTREQLDRAMAEYMEKAAAAVSRIPLENRTILSMDEALELQRRREAKHVAH